MEWKDKIVTDPEVCGGRPRLKGTRLTVEFLLGLKAAGWSEEQILENYPNVTREDLQAVFAYSQAIIEDEAFLPASAA
ncbi:MAG: DUF433 domain-containing protein [Verrucomicrobiales bacterium]|nr:DUF433 domain-containing protein [Verrucomicrobiales bacterium]